MTTPTAQPPEGNAFAKLMLDLGPLIVFFAAYAITKNVFLATGIFMAGTAAAMLWSKLRIGKVSPMLWFSGVMVLGFGGLTIWFHQEWIIKVKPTLYYVMVACILFFGLWTKRPTLKLVLGSAYPGLSERGWTLLSRNWAFFFIALAISNEAVWRNFSTEFWIGYKFWGALPATLLFAAANIPMLMRHGLATDTAVKDAPIPPVE